MKYFAHCDLLGCNCVVLCIWCFFFPHEKANSAFGVPF
jgi:hypothetical protein